MVYSQSIESVPYQNHVSILPMQIECQEKTPTQEHSKATTIPKFPAPVEEDFAKAAVYTINYDTSGINNYDNLFLRINYRGDVARVYADGRLVADNFWNGKEMWVRMADLVGKKVELKILPLRKDAPVYFQKEQKAMIEAAKGDYMLGLDSVEVIERHTLEFNDAF